MNKEQKIIVGIVFVGLMLLVFSHLMLLVFSHYTLGQHISDLEERIEVLNGSIDERIQKHIAQKVVVNLTSIVIQRNESFPVDALFVQNLTDEQKCTLEFLWISGLDEDVNDIRAYTDYTRLSGSLGCSVFWNEEGREPESWWLGSVDFSSGYLSVMKIDGERYWIR